MQGQSCPYNIQIQHLLKLNAIGFMEKIFQSNNSNTTLVKVKCNRFIKIIASKINSNTTLVKVKSSRNNRDVQRVIEFKYNTC